jgi:excisionase family DNA binding protein
MSNELEPKYITIRDAARYTAESVWTVNKKLRLGIYRALKSGRRTLVEFETVKRHLATLPPAKFAKPVRKSQGRR